VGLKWTDDDAKSSRDRAVAAIVAIATSLAEGREVTVDSAIAEEVRRRDAQMWARLEARGNGS
jgi:hypothetical protein